MAATRFEIEKFDEWEELDEKALSAIQLCVTNTVL
ncbi:hypothetical protein Goklo_008161 [Gossypium klotzschianum]|uniref:Uncharacterized protein n=1 Tax=Gossypium klotzschianum TaxID=34286 RepID=A0A7J8UZ83_9ROSI|nr:hypothetical protein [Gossypium klotzschianum]